MRLFQMVGLLVSISLGLLKLISVVVAIPIATDEGSNLIVARQNKYSMNCAGLRLFTA